MTAELGHFALILAGLLALLLGVLALRPGSPAPAARLPLLRSLALGQSLFVLLAWGCLVASFVADDFSLRNVAENSNALLPLGYRVAAAWGSHEGSMLLWLALQALWLLALARAVRGLPVDLSVPVLGVMGWLAAAFIGFVLGTSNPFLRIYPVAAQGRDLNPLLQDPGMVLHPPLLYMGYVGCSVAFAFAVAVLLARRRGHDWAGWARPWATAAWCCLTLGVALGSGWAYYELGWGGWWFWDPVENAALMPWLAATALLHALALTQRRGLFPAWTLLLAVLCFALALLGTFLVRSGVLSSVHAFAIDPRRGVFILLFLSLVVGLPLALFARRAADLRGGAPAAPLSRETLLLLNTLLLAVAAGTVLLGTLYPLAYQAAGLGRLSVGAPYFEAVFVPLMLPLVFLMGLAPLARWTHAPLPALWRRLRWAGAAALLLALGAAWAAGVLATGPVLGLLAALWVAATIGLQLGPRLRGRSPRWWGMTLAHAGVALFVAAVTLVRSGQTELDLRLAPGDSATIAGHALRFVGVTSVDGPNYKAQRGVFELTSVGEGARQLLPEKRQYLATPQTPTTEAAIASSWRGDIHLALGEPTGQGAWTVRLQHKPFMNGIWAGCLLMALGGGLTLAGGRQRRSLQLPGGAEFQHADLAR